MQIYADFAVINSHLLFGEVTSWEAALNFWYATLILPDVFGFKTTEIKFKKNTTPSNIFFIFIKFGIAKFMIIFIGATHY